MKGLARDPPIATSKNRHVGYKLRHLLVGFAIAVFNTRGQGGLRHNQGNGSQ